jgi:hypothetical protein
MLSCLRHQIQGNQVMAALVVTAQVSGRAQTQEIAPWCIFLQIQTAQDR